MSSSGRARDEVCAVLEKYGIETYILAWKDPDSDEFEHVTQGSRFWRIGMLEALKHREFTMMAGEAPDSDAGDGEGEGWKRGEPTRPRG